MNCLKKKTIIPDDVMYVFYSKTLKVVQDKAYGAVTDHAKDFCLYMSNLWSSKKYLEASSPVFIFQLGELHTCARMLDDLFAERENEYDIEVNSKWLFSKRLFFKLISENPGIKHTDLAIMMGISKSSLSQFVSKVYGLGYHYERNAGREKYYYLTKLGQKLLSRMNEEATRIEIASQQNKKEEEEERYVKLLCKYNLDHYPIQSIKPNTETGFGFKGTIYKKQNELYKSMFDIVKNASILKNLPELTRNIYLSLAENFFWVASSFVANIVTNRMLEEIANTELEKRTADIISAANLQLTKHYKVLCLPISTDKTDLKTSIALAAIDTNFVPLDESLDDTENFNFDNKTDLENSTKVGFMEKNVSKIFAN